MICQVFMHIKKICKISNLKFYASWEFQEHVTKKAAGLKKSGGDIYNVFFLFVFLMCAKTKDFWQCIYWGKQIVENIFCVKLKKTE